MTLTARVREMIGRLRNDNRVYVLGLHGQKHHGKSTTARYLEQKYGFVKVAIAQGLKDSYQALFGLSDEQLTVTDAKEAVDPFWGVSPRQMLQGGGMMLREELSQYIPNLDLSHYSVHLARLVRTMYQHYQAGHTRFVIEDVRFPDELVLLKELGATVAKVVRPGYHDPYASSSAHASETALAHHEFAVVILNEGDISALEQCIDKQFGRLRL